MDARAKPVVAVFGATGAFLSVQDAFNSVGQYQADLQRRRA